MRGIIYIALVLIFLPVSSHSQRNYTSADSITITSLVEKAQAHIDTAAYTQAQIACQQALALSKAKGFKRGEFEVYAKLADIAHQQNQLGVMNRYDSLALALARLFKDPIMLATSYELYGLYMLAIEDKKQAEKYFKDALSVQYEQEQSSATARMYTNLALVNGNDKEVATYWHLKGIKLYEKVGDTFGLAQSYSNYAAHLVSLNRHSEALDYAKRSVVLRKNVNDNYGLMYSYANISQIYTMTDSLKQALYYQQLSVKTAEHLGVDKLKAQSYVGLSLLYSRQNNNRKAFEYEYKAVKLLEASGNTEMLSRRYIALAMNYDRLKDSASASLYFSKAIDLATAHNYKDNLRDAYQQATIFYKEHKDYYNAYEHFKQYIKVRDDLADEETVAKIAELETAYETQKKEEVIRQLNSDKLIQQLQLEKQTLSKNILIIGLVIALILAYILFNRYQLKKKLEQKTALLKERSRISSELHDEVGSTLSTINILSHSARLKLNQDLVKSGSLLDKINENSQRMMDAMSDIVWSINPENDSLSNISVRMKEFATEILENKDIDYSFHVSEELMQLKLSPEVRKDLYLVFKEAVNNMAKYSSATLARISIEKQDHMLSMIIEDNGKGFDTGNPVTGNGMKNMRKRTGGHGGSFTVSSTKGSGTSISLSIPIA